MSWVVVMVVAGWVGGGRGRRRWGGGGGGGSRHHTVSISEETKDRLTTAIRHTLKAIKTKARMQVLHDYE